MLEALWEHVPRKLSWLPNHKAAVQAKHGEAHFCDVVQMHKSMQYCSLQTFARPLSRTQCRLSCRRPPSHSCSTALNAEQQDTKGAGPSRQLSSAQLQLSSVCMDTHVLCRKGGTDAGATLLGLPRSGAAPRRVCILVMLSGNGRSSDCWAIFSVLWFQGAVRTWGCVPPLFQA